MMPRLMLEFRLVPHPCICIDTISHAFRHFINFGFAMGNEQSIKHEPNSPYHGATSTKAPVMKSAMKRSRSIRNNSMGGAEKRYIPNMKQASNGLIMPTRPYHGKDSPPTGEFSPQWGWYTSLTPPDVGMYSKSQHKRSASEPARVQILATGQKEPNSTTTIQDENHQANHVFQSLQNSHAPVGWTSVPIWSSSYYIRILMDDVMSHTPYAQSC